MSHHSISQTSSRQTSELESRLNLIYFPNRNVEGWDTESKLEA